MKSIKKEATVGRQVSADIFSLGEARYQFRVGLISLKNLLLSKRLIMFRAIQLNTGSNMRCNRRGLLAT